MVSAGITGIIYYNYQKDNLLTEKLQELSAISDLKIRQITQWRFERLSDGRFLGDNIMLVEKISDCLNHKEQMPSDEMVRRS